MVWGLIASLTWPAVAFGSALEGPGLGARAVSMGGAFIGLADDWTAIYWNPAGLAQLKKPGVGVTLDIPFANASDGNSVGNYTIPQAQSRAGKDQKEAFANLSGSEPATFNARESRKLTMLPGIGFHMPLGEGFVLGGGSYLPLGTSTTWNDAVSNGTSSIYGRINKQVYLTVYNLSLSKQVLPTLSLGAGVNFLEMKIYKGTRKTNVQTGFNYTAESNLKFQGTDFEGVFGFLFKPNDKFSIGGVYRTGSQIDMQGHFYSNYQGPAGPGGLYATNINLDTDVEGVFYHPTTYGLGVALRPVKTLTLTADWSRTEWAQMRDEIRYNKQTIFYSNDEETVNWKNVNRFRVGSECKPFDNGVALRLGYYYEPSPVPAKAVGITNVVEVDKHVATSGIGYDTEQYSITLMYLYAWGKESMDNVGPNRQTVSFKKEVHSIQTAFVYWFK